MQTASIDIIQGDGNAHNIMARVSLAIRKEGATNADVKRYYQEATIADYNALIQTSMQWLDKYGY